MQGARQQPQMNFRMPKELKDWITQRAAENRRTLTGEIIFRLEESQRQEDMNEATKAA